MNYQTPPFAIQIEPSEGCSLACSFCALQSIRANGANWKTDTHGKNSTPYKFMTLETCYKIMQGIMNLGWNPRIEFAMHGNPSANKLLPEFVAIAKKLVPKAYIMITDNGSGFIKPKRILACFEAGLNTLALDDYVHANFVPLVIKNFKATEVDIPIYHYPDDPNGNPHSRFSGQKICVIQDLTQAEKGTHSNVTNQGGNSGSVDATMSNKRCAKPFRELSFRWDGSVALCCDDWPGIYKIGNIHETPLLDLWNHPRFRAARRRLYNGQRDFGPCKGCNVRTYRTGLLPDKMGKKTLRSPNAWDAKQIEEALAGKPFTPKVKK